VNLPPEARERRHQLREYRADLLDAVENPKVRRIATASPRDLELDLGIDYLLRHAHGGLDVIRGVQTLVQRANNLDVLLRHRPRSISRARRRATLMD
jgi:hypothetical protein